MSVVIDDILPREQFTATSLQTVFNVSFSADSASDVKVYARATGVAANDATQIVSSSDYNVTFIGGSLTVRVTFLVGRTLDDVITITRETPDDRDNLYTNTNFTPSMLNSDFGRTVFISQQNKLYRQEINTRYNVSETISNPKDTILPILPALYMWRMNSGGTAIESVLSTDITTFGSVDFYTKTDQTALLPNSVPINSFASGFLSNTTGTGYTAARVMTGTANQIDVANGNGVGGNPTYTLSSTMVLPGTLTLGGNLNGGGYTVSNVSQLTVDNIRIDGNTISAEDAGGNITLKPNTTGSVDIFEPPASESTGININGVTYNTALRVNDIGANAPAQFIAHRHSTTLAPVILGARTNSNTDTHADVTSGQSVLTILGAGWTTSSYKLSSAIDLSMDTSGTISATSAPGRIRFQVTPDGSLVPATALTITNDKNVKFEANTEFAAGQGITGSAGSRLIFSGNGNDAQHIDIEDARIKSAGTNSNISIFLDNKGTSPTIIRQLNPAYGGRLGLRESSTSGTNAIGLRAPNVITTSYSMVYPAAGPTLYSFLIASGTSATFDFKWSGNSTNAIQLPAGTVAQQPANNAGLIRYNSDNTTFEGNDGSNWLDVPFETVGDWTPVPKGSTTAGSPTGTFEGSFILSGTVLQFWGRVIFTSLSTMAGNFQIGGLPYIVRNATKSRGDIFVGYRNSFTNDFVISGFCGANTTNINLYNASVDNTTVAISDLSATSHLHFQGSYEIA